LAKILTALKLGGRYYYNKYLDLTKKFGLDRKVIKLTIGNR